MLRRWLRPGAERCIRHSVMLQYILCTVYYVVVVVVVVVVVTQLRGRAGRAEQHFVSSRQVLRVHGRDSLSDGKQPAGYHR